MSDGISKDLLKVRPPAGYPPEEGRFVRGDDYSPVAVAAILDTYDFKIPAELDRIISVAIESGAAIAGSVQTENIGIEKIVANVVANPNIRYLVMCWRESQGHLTADAIVKFLKNGVDERRKIIGALAPTPYLYNLQLEAIDRFREQVKLVNLISEEEPWFAMNPENVRSAILACRGKAPMRFRECDLFDPGAYDKPAICNKLTWKVKEPWRPQMTSEEAELLERIKKAAQARGKAIT